MFKLQFPDATPVQKWKQFRLWRDQQLKLTDFTQMADAEFTPQEAKKFKDYRKFLRDAPQDYTTVEAIQFPGYVDWIDYETVYIDVPYTL